MESTPKQRTTHTAWLVTTIVILILGVGALAWEWHHAHAATRSRGRDSTHRQSSAVPILQTVYYFSNTP